MNSKAQVTELYIPFVIIFVLLFGVLISFVVLDKFNDAVATEFSTEAKDIITSDSNAWSLFDYGSIILVGGIFIGLVISGFYIRTNPVFFFAFLTAFVAVMLVSPALSNVMDQVKDTDVVNDSVVVADSFPILDYVTDNFPLFMAIGGFLFILALFAKPFLFGGRQE